MTTEQYRWVAIIVALLTGAVLVGFGLLDGNAWATLAGGVLTGGSGAVAIKGRQ